MELEFVFKKFCIVGVHKKVFDWLAANKFLSNSKNYLRFTYISIFSMNCFFLLMTFLNTSA